MEKVVSLEHDFCSGVVIGVDMLVVAFVDLMGRRDLGVGKRSDLLNVDIIPTVPRKTREKNNGVGESRSTINRNQMGEAERRDAGIYINIRINNINIMAKGFKSGYIRLRERNSFADV